MQAMGVSQPTLSRVIRTAPDHFTAFRVSGERTPKYGLLRVLPGGLNARQTIYRVTAAGAMAPYADVEFLSGGGTVEHARVGKPSTRLYAGLPPYMLFASPSGFLGRQVAHAAAQEMPLPESLKDWGDEHKIAYLFSRGLNLPGNLIYGGLSLQKEMELGVEDAPVPDQLEHYVAMASQLREASYGSSAGGEQPKFLSLSPDVGHVIVKFAKRGSRMGDLLPLEHLALRALERVDVATSATRLLLAQDYVFLEVQRFDRVGRSGRVGMLSAGAVDDEFFGSRDTWPEFAARCEKAKYLSANDARRIDVMAAFSELIGNSDRHFENLSLLIDDDGEYLGVAPAYDILPMRYASIGGGIDPDLLPIEPKIGSIGARPEVWARAAEAAQWFWTEVERGDADGTVAQEFRVLASTNRAVAAEFVRPLLPA